MDDLHKLRVDLLSDFFLFTRFIFKERTGREFIVSKPVSAVSHFIEIANALQDVFYGKIPRLAINCPPGWSKCLSPDTRIMTPNGLIAIGEIQPDQQVYSYDNGKLTIEKCLAIEPAFKNSVIIKMISNKEIICSTDHRMLTAFGYVEAWRLVKGERIWAINNEIDDFYLDEVVSVEPVGKKELIHIQVSNTENFIANGLVSHNSELIKSFITWSYAWYPDCNNLYISYAHELASSHTHVIKQTMMLPIYRRLFEVEINRESSAKDFFKTTRGGAVAAFGSTGPVTGRDAGLPALDRYSGGVFIDDIHKPDEVHSDVIREKVKRNYIETIEPRCRGHNVPIVIIGQRLHQDDLFSYLLDGKDGNSWHHINIKALDDAGNARYPEVMPRETLTKMRKFKPYVFASQYMQDPIPAGGGLYKEEDFPLLDEMPEIISTFITADTSETDKDWNDKTVFSFWGLYQIKVRNVPVPNLYALHWLDCRQMNIEPKDLESEFLDFWGTCMTFKVKPQCAIIEKKSTGVTLVSVLKNTQGLKVIGIDRTAKSGSKTQRFIDMQQYIAAKRVSLPLLAKHTKMCVEHMTDITANNTHRHDDVADTAVDACNAAFIDKIIVHQAVARTDYEAMASNMTQGQRHIDFLRNKAHGSGQNSSR